jgi:hypothetical protein
MPPLLFSFSPQDHAAAANQQSQAGLQNCILSPPFVPLTLSTLFPFSLLSHLPHSPLFFLSFSHLPLSLFALSSPSSYCASISTLDAMAVMSSSRCHSTSAASMWSSDLERMQSSFAWERRSNSPTREARESVRAPPLP